MTFTTRRTASSTTARSDDPIATLSLDAADVGVWEWQPSDGTLRCCSVSRTLCGLPPNEPLALDALLARIHPEDRKRTAASLHRALGDGMSCSVECRTLEGGLDRWIALEGRRCPGTGGLPSMAGVMMDITARKIRDQQRELLVRDLSHRISNAFAVLSAVVHVSSRGATTAEGLTGVLQSRIDALARAFTVPTEDDGVALHAIVERELAPFSDLARVAVSGEPTWLPSRFAIPMTLIVHELATNAMKHGALRREDGELSVRWYSRTEHRTASTVLHWKEHSSAPVTPPTRSGLGSSLLSLIAGNVAGDIRMEYQPDGLAATVVLPCDGAPRASS